MITYETDELKKSNRKNINTARKRAENIEVKKGRTAKIYTMNIERKRLLKQRREKALQNAKGKRPAEEYFLTALIASCKIHRALKNTQKSKKSDNGSINDENINITMIADNINNLEIVANNDINTTTNAEDTDIEPVDRDNINNTAKEIDKSEDMSEKHLDFEIEPVNTIQPPEIEYTQTPQALVPIDTPLSIIHKHIPRNR